MLTEDPPPEVMLPVDLSAMFGGATSPASIVGLTAPPEPGESVAPGAVTPTPPAGFATIKTSVMAVVEAIASGLPTRFWDGEGDPTTTCGLMGVIPGRGSNEGKVADAGDGSGVSSLAGREDAAGEGELAGAAASGGGGGATGVLAAAAVPPPAAAGAGGC
ncbi:hypothetical protein HDU96_007689 [Phlyctochytrium bullatum]|nr:hypothetical protein HDU96_007689 [Phlyctochytrium bullatum]